MQPAVGRFVTEGPNRKAGQSCDRAKHCQFTAPLDYTTWEIQWLSLELLLNRQGTAAALWGQRGWQAPLFKFPQEPLMPAPAPDALLRQPWVWCTPVLSQVCAYTSSRTATKMASVWCFPGTSLSCIHSSPSWSVKATRIDHIGHKTSFNHFFSNFISNYLLILYRDKTFF